MCKEQLPLLTPFSAQVTSAEIKDTIHSVERILSQKNEEHRRCLLDQHYSVTPVVSHSSVTSAIETFLENELEAQLPAMWYLSTEGLVSSR